jgi:hypothetical protein
MIEHKLEQGSPEWVAARIGIPTASQFARLITPKKREPSASRHKYRAELLTEWLLGQPLDWGATLWMGRGSELEDEARRFYELERDVEVQRIGFVTRDDGRVGGSPDGLVGDDGGVEIKCPSALQHVQYMLGEDPEYFAQVQGYLYLTDRRWWDLLSYNPALPPVLKRIPRDDEFIAALVAILDKDFLPQLDREKAQLNQYRVAGPVADFAPMTAEEVARFLTDVREAEDAGRVDERFAEELAAAVFSERWPQARIGWRAIRGAA